MDNSERLSADARRESLLDATKALVNDVGPNGVTMGSVAEHAEVTRALVYKHFENRDDLLVALYRREAKRLDKEIRVRVEAAPGGFEPKLRAFVDATIEVVGEHAPFFAPLRDASASAPAREDQRYWDSRSVNYFAGLATDAYQLDTRTARPAVAMLLSGVPSLLSQVRHRPSRRAELVDIYVWSVVGALIRLAAAGTRQ